MLETIEKTSPGGLEDRTLPIGASDDFNFDLRTPRYTAFDSVNGGFELLKKRVQEAVSDLRNR